MEFGGLTLMIERLVRWQSGSQQDSIYKYFKHKHQDEISSPNVVLVQCVEDLYYLGVFGQIASSLRQTNSVRVEQYVLRSLRVGESKSFLAFIFSRVFINSVHNFKWVRLYKSFCDGVGYRSTSVRPIKDVVDAYHAWRCWRNLTDKGSLIKLQIDGTVVGDLVNDSFLRFKPAPTLDLKNSYLLALLWQAHRDVRRAKDYFTRAKPRLYLTSYSTYIQHGIPVRVALQHGVKVFSFGNYQEFAKELTLEDWLHTKNPDSYAEEFLKLDDQSSKLALAEMALSVRLSGGVDSATAYMKKSAYTESNEPVPTVRGAVVIFLHDFYDSPHVYREMVFTDFWEWVCFSIETLKKANIDFFVKPHPNQIALSDKVLDQLKQRYPGLSMISSGITNKQLAEAGMSCAVTVYGTVASEMAYLGIPSIACAHHPHINFAFCRTARNRDGYALLLQNATQLTVDKEIMYRESLIFYHMHNQSGSNDAKVLRDVAMQFRKKCGESGGQHDLVGELSEIATLPGYKQILYELM